MFDPSRLALRYAFLKEADLSPPLGIPGGQCQVIDRVLENVRGEKNRERLIKKIEEAKHLDNKESDLIYDAEKERGPSGTPFKGVWITPHALYRMDLRGVTVNDVRRALREFHEEWAKEKNDFLSGKGGHRYLDWEDRIQSGRGEYRKIVYEDSVGLTLAFEVGKWSGKERGGVAVITAFWSTKIRQRPMSRTECGEWGGWSDLQSPPKDQFDRSFPPRTADLYPALGFPGGACQVIERIDLEVPNLRLREKLIDQVEEGKSLTNPEASKVYQWEREKGPSGTRFKQLLISAHAQYRMDQRGITVPDLRLFFKRFQKEWAGLKSQGHWQARAWESEMMWKTPIEWTDSQGLHVVFQVEDRTAKIITVYWKGLSDPRPVDESACALPERVASLRREAGAIQDAWEKWIVQPFDVIRKHHKEFVQGPVDDAMDLIIKELAPELVKAIGEQEVDSDVDEFHEGAIRGKWEAERGFLSDSPKTETEDFQEGYEWGYANPDRVESKARDLPHDVKKRVVQDAVREFRGRVTEEVVRRAFLKSWNAVSPVMTFRAIVEAVKRYGWKLGLVIALVEITETFVLPAVLISITGKPELSVVGMLPLSEILYAVVFRILGRTPEEIDQFDPAGHLDWYEAQFGLVRLASGGGDFNRTDRKRVPGDRETLDALEEGSPRLALKIPPTPGYQTLVREDSAKNLPADLDREKEQALPLPGSATPGGAGRDIGKFEFNTPDNDIDKRPRTLSEPGEEYGNPTKFDYNTVTRRTMTSAEIAVRAVMVRMAEELEEDEGVDKTAYTRKWKPGQRQRRSKGVSKVKRRQDYRKNRAKNRLRSKKWRKKNRNKGSFKQSEKRRRNSVRKRRNASLEMGPCPSCLAARFASESRPPRVPGGVDNRRQREQSTQDRRDDALYYSQNRSRRQRQSERWYETKCKRNCKTRRELYEESPERYERKPPSSRRASVLTVPEIAFGIGPEMALGYVHSISSMTGMVTFEIAGEGFTNFESLPVEVFMRVAAFLSDEDIDSFFDLVDVEIGLEAYEDLDESGLRECAALFDKDPDSDEFRGKCFELTGEEDFSNLSGEQMDQLNDALILGVLEGGGEPRSSESGDDEDETIGEEYDPHLFYGEVEESKLDKEASLPTHFDLPEVRETPLLYVDEVGVKLARSVAKRYAGSTGPTEYTTERAD